MKIKDVLDSLKPGESIQFARTEFNQLKIQKENGYISGHRRHGISRMLSPDQLNNAKPALIEATIQEIDDALEAITEYTATKTTQP